jgi:hypothetical protein
MAYPVQCGMECIRQNDDSGIEVASAVVMTIFSGASSESWQSWGRQSPGLSSAPSRSQWMLMQALANDDDVISSW